MDPRQRAATALKRRRFLQGAAATATVGAVATTAGTGPADATGRSRFFRNRPIPKPIAFSTPVSDPGPPPPFDSIRWTLPGPEGAVTQKLQLPAFGPDTDPNTIGDFEGFTAFGVVAGEATGGDGERFDCELDVRVMQGRYVAEDGEEYRGTFAFL